MSDIKINSHSPRRQRPQSFSLSFIENKVSDGERSERNNKKAEGRKNRNTNEKYIEIFRSNQSLADFKQQTNTELIHTKLNKTEKVTSNKVKRENKHVPIIYKTLRTAKQQR